MPFVSRPGSRNMRKNRWILAQTLFLFWLLWIPIDFLFFCVALSAPFGKENDSEKETFEGTINRVIVKKTLGWVPKIVHPSGFMDPPIGSQEAMREATLRTIGTVALHVMAASRPCQWIHDSHEFLQSQKVVETLVVESWYHGKPWSGFTSTRSYRRIRATNPIQVPIISPFQILQQRTTWESLEVGWSTYNILQPGMGLNHRGTIWLLQVFFRRKP